MELRDASVQDIQLELLRRSAYNAMNGQRVADSLLRHRDLWISALLDRQGLPDYDNPGRLLRMGLIKLRDLPENIWNADTLFIHTATHDKARQLARIAEDEEWCGEVVLIESQEEIDGALGTGRDEYGMLYVWWD
ncbi:MAG TPA: hypothetical protein VFE47_21880 [Tepidisphaeraceae bacterium]|jgi:hypothetical protein|nr:hypothetical protein [Tepidisphaeraceae bacterium]